MLRPSTSLPHSRYFCSPHDGRRLGQARAMLAEVLPQQSFSQLLFVLRLGRALMLLPGFGESYISPRIRLLLALTVTVVVLPVLPPVLPPLPESAVALFLLIFGEIGRAPGRERVGKYV